MRMFNIGRRDQPPETKEPAKNALKPALYDAPLAAGRGVTSPAPAPAAARGAAAPASRDAAPAANTADKQAAAAAAAIPVLVPPGSKLSVGVNIKLNGVEVSDCDVLVIEGHVEATVHSKAMEIAEPGTLKGTALIDVAEIRGEFAGELTARTRLVVHGTGRVSGTIRYGKLIVAEGGEISGDVKRLDPHEAEAVAATAPVARPASVDARPAGVDARPALRPAPEQRLV
jgi:cytoskeletal protein CcmA (bactofilin family)